jgi:hypothetical protein
MGGLNIPSSRFGLRAADHPKQPDTTTPPRALPAGRNPTVKRILLNLIALPFAAAAQPAPQFPTGDQYLQSRSSQAEAATVQALNEVARQQAVIREREARIKELEAAKTAPPIRADGPSK